MSEDRVLLEKAARAAGLEVEWMHHPAPAYFHNWADGREWNPLTDDGDALRLAAKLRLLVDFSSCCAMNLKCADDEWFGGVEGDERIGCSPDECNGLAATRRAIVRAAASLADNTKGLGGANVQDQ